MPVAMNLSSLLFLNCLLFGLRRDRTDPNIMSPLEARREHCLEVLLHRRLEKLPAIHILRRAQPARKNMDVYHINKTLFLLAIVFHA